MTDHGPVGPAEQDRFSAWRGGPQSGPPRAFWWLWLAPAVPLACTVILAAMLWFGDS